MSKIAKHINNCMNMEYCREELLKPDSLQDNINNGLGLVEGPFVNGEL